MVTELLFSLFSPTITTNIKPLPWHLRDYHIYPLNRDEDEDITLTKFIRGCGWELRRINQCCSNSGLFRKIMLSRRTIANLQYPLYRKFSESSILSKETSIYSSTDTCHPKSRQKRPLGHASDKETWGLRLIQTFYLKFMTSRHLYITSYLYIMYSCALLATSKFIVAS